MTPPREWLPMPKLLVLYHFFHPDDVVSARQFSGLAEEQARRGWSVSVLTSNRSCWNGKTTFAQFEDWNGVQVHRVFRPDWNQAKPLSRLANSAWMLVAWLWTSLRLGPQDVIVIGSDPAFANLIAIPFRLLRPRTKLVHWCFDLYPEAIEAEGISGGLKLLPPVAKALMGWSYRCCDALVDLGACMRERLARYGSKAERVTLVPWALVEPHQIRPPAAAVRKELFGEAKLGLLYSGTMGRAHEFELFLELARACRAQSGNDIVFSFACRGNRAEELRNAVTPEDTNVRFAPFADESALQARLEAADVHLLSLRPEWSGIVVPSKFFGSLAVGRPVVYAGPEESAIARWIGEADVGLHLQRDNLGEVVKRLHGYVNDRTELKRWQENALATYEARFSKRAVNDGWDSLLRRLVGLACG